MSLPDLTLKLHSEKKTTLENKGTNMSSNTNNNTNTINNNIILEPKALNGGSVVALESKIPQTNTKIKPSASMESLAVKSPDNVRRFKDQFTAYLIEYFKNDLILLNNLLEISSKIVFKVDDLKTLIGILLEIETVKIEIEYEDMIKSGCCGKICKRVPLFKKVTDIIINGKQRFTVSYDSIAVQLQNTFNVSLSHVIA